MNDESSTNTRLNQLRTRIDDIDRRFVGLIRERMDAVRDVRACKTDDPNAPFVDPEREKRVFARWAEHARALDLSPYHVGRVLREVLAYSRRKQENLPGRSGLARQFHRVGYQGVRACYADLALTKLVAARDGEPPERIGFTTLPALFDALDRGEIDRAIVPVENSTSGAIVEVNELLASREIVIVDEEIYPVQHCLAAIEGTTIDDVRVVRSHPVALHQCARFLSTLPHARAEAASNTAHAALAVAEQRDPSVACICSPEAATTYGLTVLHTNAADQPHNQTRFVLLSKTAEPLDARQQTKTSMILTLDHRQGSLAACLQLFANHGINLTRLESRPQPERPWEYLFYLDFEGNPETPEVNTALEQVRRYCNHLQMLGTYPLRSIERQPVPNQPPRPGLVPPSERSSAIVRVGELEVGGPRFVLAAALTNLAAAPMEELVAGGVSLIRARVQRTAEQGKPSDRSTATERDSLVANPLTIGEIDPYVDELAELGRHFECPVALRIDQAAMVQRAASRVDLLAVPPESLGDLGLLRALARVRRPIALQRDEHHTLDDLLAAAEYLVSGGNNQLVLVDPGVRKLEPSGTAAVDVSALTTLKSLSRFPVFVDASTISRADLLVPLALAVAAAGADGLIVGGDGPTLSRITSALGPSLAALGRTL